MTPLLRTKRTLAGGPTSLLQVMWHITCTVIAFGALDHGEILWGDAVCLCDGETPPTRRQRHDEWGTPFFGRISVHSWATRCLPIRRKVRDEYRTPSIN